MATVQRYVDTASSGGDGTTQNHSGATAAYASLSSWEANETPGATDDMIVDCAGSTADTTAVTVDFATTPATILIRGDRAAPDNDGFYSGPLTTSTSHYRLAPASGSPLIISEPEVTVDGIQIVAAGGAFFSGIAPLTANGNCTVRKCRIRAGSSTDYGIGRSAAYGKTGTWTYENNLVVGFNVDGIQCWGDVFFSATFNVLNNTVYGDGSCDGIKLVQAEAASGAPVFNVKGNAIANSGSQQDIDSAGMLETSGTINYQDNATEQFNLGTTDEIDLGLPTDAWTSPGTTAGSDFTVKNTSSALYNALNPTLVTQDITDFTRDGSNHDVGAFELVVAAVKRTDLIVAQQASMRASHY